MSTRLTLRDIACIQCEAASYVDDWEFAQQMAPVGVTLSPQNPLIVALGETDVDGDLIPLPTSWWPDEETRAALVELLADQVAKTRDQARYPDDEEHADVLARLLDIQSRVLRKLSVRGV